MVITLRNSLKTLAVINFWFRNTIVHAKKKDFISNLNLFIINDVPL